MRSLKTQNSRVLWDWKIQNAINNVGAASKILIDSNSKFCFSVSTSGNYFLGRRKITITEHCYLQSHVMLTLGPFLGFVANLWSAFGVGGFGVEFFIRPYVEGILVLNLNSLLLF